MLNKKVVDTWPCPATLCGLQLCSCVFVCYFLWQIGAVQLSRPSGTHLRCFALYCCLFAISCVASLDMLRQTSVPFVLALRATLPACVQAVDVAIGGPLPSRRSVIALALVLLFALSYVKMTAPQEVPNNSQLLQRRRLGLTPRSQGVRRSAGTDGGAHLVGPTWHLAGLSELAPALWVASLTAQLIYGKQLSSQHTSLTNWDRVLLTNGLSIPFVLALLLLSGERERLSLLLNETAQWPSATGAHPSPSGRPLLLGVVALSCIVGIGLSWSSWQARSLISATAFTLAGLATKVLALSFASLFVGGASSALSGGRASQLALLGVLGSSLLYEAASRSDVLDAAGKEPVEAAPAGRSEEIERATESLRAAAVRGAVQRQDLRNDQT